jgi:hypothetical protein
MNDFKKELNKFNVDNFKASKATSDDTVQAQFFGGRCFRCFRCFECFRCFRYHYFEGVTTVNRRTPHRHAYSGRTGNNQQ